MKKLTGRSTRAPRDARAPRDGHEFHEAWTARKALQLLKPDSELIGIAVEGPSPNDQLGAFKATGEIADITLYYNGESSNFKSCKRTTIVQFKYSIVNKDKEFRASNAKKTIAKFAESYDDYKNGYGTQAVSKRLSFQLVTNQPIYKPLKGAIEAIANGLPRTGETKRQADQFIKATGLRGKIPRQICLKGKSYWLLGRSTGNQG